MISQSSHVHVYFLIYRDNYYKIDSIYQTKNTEKDRKFFKHSFPLSVTTTEFILYYLVSTALSILNIIDLLCSFVFAMLCYRNNMRRIVKLLYLSFTVIIALIGSFYVLNYYIYTTKQGAVTSTQDGEYFGFIRAITDNGTRIDFDDARWLTGKEGEDAAIEVGICTETTRKECLPNGFFIKKTSTIATQSYTLDPHVRIIMQTWNMENTGNVEDQEITLHDFVEVMASTTTIWSKVPYRIFLTKGAITAIREVYVP